MPSFVNASRGLALVLSLLGFFLSFVSASPTPAETLDDRGLTLPHIPIVDALLALGASPPPPILQTTTKSPECAAINQGQLMCCRATIAGDVQLVVWVSALYGYNLNPNDVNGLNCKSSWNLCPQQWKSQRVLNTNTM
jgi:hypothetical protein